jgi:hypothetical protein
MSQDNPQIQMAETRHEVCRENTDCFVRKRRTQAEGLFLARKDLLSITLNRPRHLKSAVIVLAAVGGREIRFLRISFVMVDPTRPPAQVGFATEMEYAISLCHLQRHRVTEPNYLLVDCMEPRLIGRIVLLSNQATQITVMSVAIAQPGAFPAAQQAVRGNRLSGGLGPGFIEARATTGQHQCPQ